MARRQMEIGEVGKISCTRQQTGRYKGKYRARVRYRDQTGAYRSTETIADTKGVAESRAQDKAHELANAGNMDIGPNSPVADLVESWWETEQDRHKSGKISEGTLAIYADTKDRIISGIGDLKIREAKAPRISAWIKREGAGHYSVQRELKRHLTAIFKHGMELDAVGDMRTNPAQVATIEGAPKREVEAYSPEDVELLRKMVREYEDGNHKPSKGGRPRALYLADFVDLMLSTGCRISEMLGLRWEDVDLASEQPTVTIVGIAKTRKADPAKGKGYLYWQAKGKTPSAWRTIPIGKTAVEILLRLHVNNDQGHKYVFSTATGTMRSPANVRSALRKAAREAEVKISASKTHTLRKTVASLVAEGADAETVAKVLGHGDIGQTASKHYIKRARETPNVSDVLERSFSTPEGV